MRDIKIVEKYSETYSIRRRRPKETPLRGHKVHADALGERSPNVFARVRVYALAIWQIWNEQLAAKPSPRSLAVAAFPAKQAKRSCPLQLPRSYPLHCVQDRYYRDRYRCRPQYQYLPDASSACTYA